MTEAQRIADQLQRSQKGPAWHGPALGELLRDLDAAAAQRRTLPGAHNIWELLLHVNAWQSAALEALAGRALPELDGSQDWPAAGSTEEDWHHALGEFDRVNRGLGAGLGSFSDQRLSDDVPGRDYSFYFLLHGVVQHNLYHAGQIAILKAGMKAATNMA
jgi:hypothetical protein